MKTELEKAVKDAPMGEFSSLETSEYDRLKAKEGGLVEYAKTVHKQPGELTNPTRSDSIDKLAAALSKAQGEIEGATKDTVNPFFNKKYADLASVWNVIRKPLTDNGLAITQENVGDCETVIIVTTLWHTSGQWKSSRLPMKPVPKWKEVKEGDVKKLVQLPPTPQELGSTITYARRYDLQAIIGVAPEDDDGNAATGKTQDKKKVDVKEPSGEKSGNMGEAKNKVLASIKTLPKAEQSGFNSKVYRAKTLEDINVIAGELAAKLL